jgi:hypothetical protein
MKLKRPMRSAEVTVPEQLTSPRFRGFTIPNAAAGQISARVHRSKRRPNIY